MKATFLGNAVNSLDFIKDRYLKKKKIIMFKKLKDTAIMSFDVPIKSHHEKYLRICLRKKKGFSEGLVDYFASYEDLPDCWET